MKPPFLDIIPHRFRRRSLGVTLSVFTRALLNFAGLAVLIPVLVIILDTEGIRSNRWLAALYDFGGFTSDRTFILTVCACVVAVILFKSLANLALYKIERNFIYDLYRELSRRLYVDYRNRGLGFIKSSNSAVLARNVNVVCLTFVTGVLMPVAAMTSEAVLFALLFGSLAIYNPLVALLTLAIFVPSVALYYCLVRQRLNRYGEEENRAQRRKSRTVIETFRGYADLEIAGAYPAMLSDFDRSMDEIIRVRQRNATIAALPPMFTEVGLAVGMAVLNMGGGATVPLFGSLFSGMARAVPEGAAELTKEQLAEAFKSGEARLLKFSKAPLGGKTMVDALTPAVAAFADYGGADIAAALEAARLAAHEGCMKTKDYVAHFGRAKNLGERALGIPDPGSVSVSIIFKAFAKSAAEE